MPSKANLPPDWRNEPCQLLRGARNCTLCPLMNRGSFEKAIRNLPNGYLKRVLSVLKEIRGRYREGTFSARKLDEWIPLIEEELARRT